MGSEFIGALLQAVIVAVVPVLAVYMGRGFQALADYCIGKTRGEAARKYLEAAGNAAATAVTYTSQVYVDALKEKGDFSKENQEWALKVAVAKARTLLTEEAKDFLTEAYGDLGKYLESLVEAEVKKQK